MALTARQILVAMGPGMLVVCFVWGLVIAAGTPPTWHDVLPSMEDDQDLAIMFSLAGIPSPAAMHVVAPATTWGVLVLLWQTRRKNL